MAWTLTWLAEPPHEPERTAVKLIQILILIMILMLISQSEVSGGAGCEPPAEALEGGGAAAGGGAAREGTQGCRGRLGREAEERRGSAGIK